MGRTGQSKGIPRPPRLWSSRRIGASYFRATIRKKHKGLHWCKPLFYWACRPGLEPGTCDLMLPCVYASFHLDIQRFHTLPCPRGPTKKLEARLDAWVVGEAADLDLSPQRIPAVEGNQFVQQLFERDAVERVVGLSLLHGLAESEQGRVPSPTRRSWSARPCAPVRRAARIRKSCTESPRHACPRGSG